MLVIQYVYCFINKVQKTKMSIELVNKLISNRELVLKDIPIFLVKTHLKPILGNFQK